MVFSVSKPSARDELRRRVAGIARQAFFERGIRQVTTDEIARRAGISKRTLYELFPSKLTLLREAMREQLDEMERSVVPIAEADDRSPLEKFEELIAVLHARLPRPSAAFFHDLPRVAPEVWAEMDARRRRILTRTYRGLLEEAQAQAVVRADLDLELVLEVILTVVQNVVRPERLAHSRWTLADLARELFGLLAFGILTEQGRRRLAERVAAREGAGDRDTAGDGERGKEAET